MAGKGGKREGAGRKPNKVNLLKKSVALGLLSEQQERNQWTRFFESSDENIRLKAFLAWNDRAFGKAPQAIEVAGKDGEAFEVLVRRVGD